MNERELKEYQKEVERSVGESKWTERLYEDNIRIQADIARQLTRIADQGEPQKITIGDLQAGIPPTPDVADGRMTDALPDSLTIAIDSGIASLKTMEFSDIEEIKATIRSIIAEMEPPFDNYLKVHSESAKGKPDALVEAVRKFMKNNVLTTAALIAREEVGKKTIDVNITEVRRLKAAHEKAASHD